MWNVVVENASLKVSGMTRMRKWLLLALLSLSTVISANCDFDDVPVMSEMRLFPVLGNAVHNNRPMMVKGFTVDLGMQEVADFYHRKWKGRYSDSVFAQWNQISTLTKDCLMTIQIAANGDATQGRIVISNIPTMSSDAEMGEGVLKPNGSNVISDLVTDDGPKKGRVTLMLAEGLPQDLAKFYQSSLTSRGWRQDQDFMKDEARVLIFRKGLDVQNILLIPTPEFTQILINTETVD